MGMKVNACYFCGKRCTDKHPNKNNSKHYPSIKVRGELRKNFGSCGKCFQNHYSFYYSKRDEINNREDLK